MGQPRLRIVYAGDLNPAGTCFQRLGALHRLGHEVEAVQIFPTDDGRGLLSKLRHRTMIGPGLSAINQALLAAVQQHRPDVLWVDKGIYLWPQTVRQAKHYCHTLAHYNPDDPFGGAPWGWRQFVKAIPAYDVHFVPRDVNLAEYIAAGGRHVLRSHWAYEPTIHYPRQIDSARREQLGGPVGFIGNYEPERARTLAAIAAAGIGVRVWGGGWDSTPHRHPRLRIEGRPLLVDDYAEAISAFDINLCFLRKVNRDQSTTRSVEIPACGGFMLAERTDEHRRLFDEDTEAAFFGSDEECVTKLRYYLEHSTERREIAARGHLRCEASGYGNDQQLARMLRQVAEIGFPDGAPTGAWQ